MLIAHNPGRHAHTQDGIQGGLRGHAPSPAEIRNPIFGKTRKGDLCDFGPAGNSFILLLVGRFKELRNAECTRLLTALAVADFVTGTTQKRTIQDRRWGGACPPGGNISYGGDRNGALMTLAGGGGIAPLGFVVGGPDRITPSNFGPQFISSTSFELKRSEQLDCVQDGSNAVILTLNLAGFGYVIVGGQRIRIHHLPPKVRVSKRECLATTQVRSATDCVKGSPE